MKARGKIDSDCGSQIVIDIGHSLIHQGNSFVASNRTVNTNAANYVVDARTATLETHMLFGCICAQDCQLTLLRNPTWTSTAGTVLTNVNRNENMTVTAGIIVYKDPTVSATGTAVIINDYIPASSKQGSVVTGGVSAVRPEFILKPGNSYLLSVVPAASTTTVNIFDFYELV